LTRPALVAGVTAGERCSRRCQLVAHVRTLPKKQDGSRRYQVRYVRPDGRERAKNFGRKVDDARTDGRVNGKMP
jgi:hypothetical protein